jgi:hypothetical protein
MRTGEFRDRHGVAYRITRDVLNKLAETFTPSKPPALLIGHPDRASVPSFGVVEALKAVGDKLLFRPGKVLPEFMALVNKGGFPGVSAGLSKDLSRLDHVAFLSAQNPAIDGLEPVAEFAAMTDEDTVSLDVTEPAGAGLAEFGSVPDWWVSSRLKAAGALFRALKNRMIEQDGVEAAEALISESSLALLMDDPPVEEPVLFSAEAGSESPTGAAIERSRNEDYKAKYEELLPQFENAVKTVATIDGTNKRLLSENAALTKKVEALEKHSRLVEFGAWLEERIAEGRVLPDEKVYLVERMEHEFQLNGAEFSKDPEKLPYALDLFKQKLMSRPRRKLTEALDGAQFAAGSALDGAELGRLIRAYIDEQAARGVSVRPSDAVSHVMKRDGLNAVPAV